MLLGRFFANTNDGREKCFCFLQETQKEKILMDAANELDIAWKIKEQYNSSAAADRYAEYFKGSLRHRRKDQREKRCIARGLSQVPRGSLVLDLPCGTGRMYPLLKDLDLHVVEADSSPYMVDHARRKAEESGLSGGQKQDRFLVSDIFHTGFENRQFDAVICNRLFHHFPDSQTRQQALRELARICSGPIVVSFFSIAATDALKFLYKKYILNKTIQDRIPIGPRQFSKDIQACGLRIERWILPRPLLSMQWYVVLRHR